VVKDASTGLPAARLNAQPVSSDRSTPAFWNMSTTRAFAARRMSAAEGTGEPALNSTPVELPSRIDTAPFFEFQTRWARSPTVKIRSPSSHAE
jgi:hypothetical protein